MCKKGDICLKCGKEILEETSNSVNKDRKRYYCLDCISHIFKLKDE